MLTANWSIHANLRVPAISRLQKIHNVGLAIKALTEKGVLMDTAKGLLELSVSVLLMK